MSRGAVIVLESSPTAMAALRSSSAMAPHSVRAAFATGNSELRADLATATDAPTDAVPADSPVWRTGAWLASHAPAITGAINPAISRDTVLT